MEVTISAKDLSLVGENALNKDQLQLLLKKTPAIFVKSRPAKGGGNWEYVSGGYVKKVLNLLFGWDWDFEIINQMILEGEAIVQGKLTVRTNGKTIVKTQFGNKDVICRKADGKPLSIGNDLKAAATDCLKKCAAELGIAADIYNKAEFREVEISAEITLEELKEIYSEKLLDMPKTDIDNAERIINTKDVKSYAKLYKSLKAI